MEKFSSPFGALILVLTAMSCGGSGIMGTAGGVCPAGTFCMTSTTFTPTTRTVTKGSTVTWQNGSGVTHNIVWNDATARTAAGAGDGTGDMPNFASGSHTRMFKTAGTYGFHCTIHAPGMVGTLTVQ